MDWVSGNILGVPLEHPPSSPVLVSLLVVQGVGVMKDEVLKLDEIEASHTLG